MRYTIHDKSSADNWLYAVCFEDGQPAYRVEPGARRAGPKWEVRDRDGRLVLSISLTPGKPADIYDIIDDEDDLIASVSNTMVVGPNRLKIVCEHGEIMIKGNLAARDFSIFQEGDEIARVDRKSLTLARDFVLDVLDFDTDELGAMAAGGAVVEFESEFEDDGFDAFLIALSIVIARIFS